MLFKKIGTVVALAACTVFSAGATQYDLASLIGQTITIGDKTFNFTSAVVTGTGSFSPGSGPVSAGEFFLTTSDGGNLVGFQLSGGLVASATSPPAGSISTVDLALAYTVSTVSHAAIMTDMHLDMNGGCVVTTFVVGSEGSCAIQTTEQVFSGAIGTTQIANLQATPSTPASSIFPSPQSVIRVTKDVSLVATAATGSVNATASVSIIDQFVSQSVPEPGFYGVLALGMGSLIFVRKRKKA